MRENKTEGKKGLQNVEFGREFALFKVNPKIYPLEVVYSAAYIMIDKAFVLLDGDPEKIIKAEIRKKKENQSLKDLVREFNEELLNYSVYRMQSERNRGIKEMILKRAILTNTQTVSPSENKQAVRKEKEETIKAWKQALRQK